MPKAVEKILRSMKGDRSTKIAKAKSAGLIRQQGGHLALTAKGKKVAGKKR